MPDDKSTKRHSSRRIMVGIFVGVPLFVLLVLGVIWCVQAISLRSKLAKIRAGGEPTNLQELNQFYRVPKGVQDTTPQWMAAFEVVKAADVSNRGKDLPIAGNCTDQIPPPGEKWEQFEASKKFVNEMALELKVVRDAAALGGAIRFPQNLSLTMEPQIDQVQETRTVARLLILDAHVQAHQGHCEKSLEDLKSVFALSDVLRTEPLIISQLVRIAIYATGRHAVEELMPHCHWNDDQLQSLQTVVMSADFKAEMQHALIGERAFGLALLDSLPLGPLRVPNKLQAVEFYEEAINSFSGNWKDLLDQEGNVDDEMDFLDQGTFSQVVFAMSRLFRPVFRQSATSAARAAAQQRCLNSGIAVQRYRLKYDHFPDSLEDLEADLFGPESDPETKFIDPFTGKELIYKKEENRVLIYSTGEDQKDDGGNLRGDDDHSPTDFGISVRRGQ